MDRSILFYVGEKFDSFEALTSKLDTYCKAAFVHYWTRDSRKIGCARILRHIDEKLKYYSLKYTCVLGGQAFHSRGTGQRYSFSIRANNCPAHISIRASKDGMHLEVISVNNEHNHDQSQEFFQALPKERRLPDNIKAEVLDLIKLQVDKRRVKEYIRISTKKVLTTKDLTNIISAGRLENRPDITPERSNELLAKVYNHEVEANLNQYTGWLKHGSQNPKAKKQYNPYHLKTLGSTRKSMVEGFTGDGSIESEETFAQIKSEALHSNYDLPSSNDSSQANTFEDMLDIPETPSPAVTSTCTPDEIVEDPGHFCITCGQVLPANHRLLQQVLSPGAVFESVNFLSPIEQVGMVEEVVSSVEVSSKGGRLKFNSNNVTTHTSVSIVTLKDGDESGSEAGRSVAVCSNDGIVTVKEEDFEDFVQRSMQS